MKTGIIFLLSLFSLACSAQKNIFNETLHPFRSDIKLDKTNSRWTFVIHNVYYDRWNLKPESKPALDSLVDFMKRNNTLVAEIGAHYAPASDYGQMCLSIEQKRAQSTVDYLIENGIDPERVVAKGYGDTSPYVVTENTKYFKKGTVLNDVFYSTILDENVRKEANRLNQRTSIRILRMDFYPRN